MRIRTTKALETADRFMICWQKSRFVFNTNLCVCAWLDNVDRRLACDLQLLIKLLCQSVFDRI